MRHAGLIYRPRELKPRVTCGNIINIHAMVLSGLTHISYYFQISVQHLCLCSAGFVHHVVGRFASIVKEYCVQR
jgi:hypothetical protein